MPINIKDPQFGAIGDGATNDTIAIQKAVNYAKTLATQGGGSYRPTVYFPAGYYYISSPIDITNATGLWLSGDGGKWLGSCIFGNTNGTMFDFSGSSQSGCENFYFLSTTSSGTTRSTIGVQFALTSGGGLNCGIRNCSFLMDDLPTANGGFGTIGILNVRAEEFYANECFVRANTPIVMSNSISLGATGTNFTVSSSYQTLTTGIGSMGVTSIIAASLQVYQKRQPALVLNGTNSLIFQGYIGRVSTTIGTNETAILCAQYTTNLKIHATIESFSRILKVVNTSLEGAKLDVVIANSMTPTTDLIDISGCNVRGLAVRISIPNFSERNNRYVIYSSPNGGGNQEANSSLRNSEINCFDIPDNRYVITADLLKKSSNVVFNTGFPFEKKGGRIRILNNSFYQAGTIGSANSVTALTFRQANKLPFNGTNGGFYRVWIDGVIRGGGYGSGESCTLSFQVQILINQRNNGNFDPLSVTVITLDKTVTNPGYLDIFGVVADVAFSNGAGVVTILPRVGGSGNAEPVYYDGGVEMQSNFLINDPIPIG